MVILRDTMKTTQSIATAMAAVVNYWGKKPNPARPFRGMARTFRNYIPGASDTDLENLILYGIPLPGDRFWGGTRQEAVIFGKAFELTAADMNHSFLFRAKNNGIREINYTQDGES